MTKKILTLCFTLLVVVGIGAYEPSRSFQVEVVGSGRPMILIPGLASHGDAWIPTAEHFATSHGSHVLTLAGFAGVPAIGRPFLETVRADLARYIRDEGLEKPIVIGHSLGGFLASWLASTELDLVGPVIAVDGLPLLPALSNPAADGVPEQTPRRCPMTVASFRHNRLEMSELGLDRRMEIEVLVAAAGDHEAFGRIVGQCSNMVSAIAVAIVRDFPASEDISQDVFLHAWANLKKLRNPASFPSSPRARQASGTGRGTTAQVAALPVEGLRVEIDAIATVSGN